MKHDSQGPVPRNDLIMISGDMVLVDLFQLAAREWTA